MKRLRNLNGRRDAALTLGVLFFFGACQTNPGPPQPVTHVVIMWLKHPERAADRAQLVRAAHSLRLMPGVTGVRTGRSVAFPAREADRNFDLGVAITFRDRAALQRYQRDFGHLDAMQRYLQPLVRRYVVYNFSDR